jgi:hypothetical protein
MLGGLLAMSAKEIDRYFALTLDANAICAFLPCAPPIASCPIGSIP